LMSNLSMVNTDGQQNGGTHSYTQAQPGVVLLDEHACGTCSTAVTEGDLSVECEICEFWHYISCEGITEETLEVLGANQQTLHWYCKKCNIGIKKIFNSVARLQMRQDDTEVKLHNMGTKLSEMQDTISTNAKDISELRGKPGNPKATEDVLKDMDERKARENNIVIYGIQECPSESGEDRKKHDLSKVDKILEVCKIKKSDRKIARTSRLGRYIKEDKKNRPLMVAFEDQAVKKTFFKNIHLMRENETM
jgi:hypothetical protein